MNEYSDINLDDLFDSLIRLPETCSSDKEWVNAYYFASAFHELCATLSERMERAKDQKRKGTEDQLKEAVETVIQMPELRSLAARFDKLGSGALQRWREWTEEQVLPVPQEGNLMELSPFLDELEAEASEKFRGAIPGHPPAQSLTREIKRNREDGNFVAALGFLRKFITSELRLSYSAATEKDRQQARNQAAHHSEKTLAELIALEYERRFKSSDQDAAWAWLEQQREAGEKISIEEFPEKMRSSVKEWQQKRNRERFEEAEQKAVSMDQRVGNLIQINETDMNSVAEPLAVAAVVNPDAFEQSRDLRVVRQSLVEDRDVFKMMRAFSRLYSDIDRTLRNYPSTVLRRTSRSDLHVLRRNQSERATQALKLARKIPAKYHGEIVDEEGNKNITNIQVNHRKQLQTASAPFRKALQQRRFLTIVKASFSAACLAIVLAAAWISIRSYMMARVRGAELEELTGRKLVLPVEAYLAGVDEKGGFYERFGPWKTARAEGERFANMERRQERELEAKIAKLTDQRDQGYAQVDFIENDQRLSDARKQLDGLAADLAALHRAELDIQSEAWEQFVTSKAQEVEGRFVALGEASDERFRGFEIRRHEGDPDELLKEVEGLQKQAETLEPDLAQPLERMNPSTEVKKKFDSVKQKLSATSKELNDFILKIAQLKAAKSLPDYLEGLKQLGGGDLTLWKYLPKDRLESKDMILAELGSQDTYFNFAFDRKGGTGSVGAGVVSTPTSATDQELDILLSLRDDWRLKEIWVYDDPRRVFTRGEVTLTQDGGIRVVTKVSMYDPTASPDGVSFEERELEERRVVRENGAQAIVGRVPREGRLSPETSFYNQMGLDNYFNIGRETKYVRSPLVLADRILIEEKVNPLYKAYWYFKIGELLSQRPDAWGLRKTSFPIDFQRLQQLRSASERVFSIDSAAWMVPRENDDWGKILEGFFEKLEGRRYLDEYRDTSILLSKLSADCFEYVGFVDERKRLQLAEGKSPEYEELWGVTEQLGGVKAAIIGKEAAVEVVGYVTDPVPFSPAFITGEAIKELRESVRGNEQLERYFEPLLGDKDSPDS